MRKLRIEQDVLALLERSPGPTTHAISEQLGISISTASKYLEALKREGRISDAAVGPAKRWRLRTDALEDFDQFKRHLTASNGRVTLFDARAALAPAESYAALMRALPPELAKSALYEMGLPLGAQAAAVASRGQERAAPDRVRAGLSYLTHKGWGRHTLLSFDGSKLHVRVDAPLLAEHARRKAPSDHVLAGALAGLFTALTGSRARCEETRCTAAGHPFCEFVVRPTA